jgi:uncharacterized C2H2 Zn-finger protein
MSDQDCTDCGERFDSEDELARHRERRHRTGSSAGAAGSGEPKDYDVPYGSVEGEVRCPVCNATFAGDDELQRHQDEEHGEQQRSA